MDIPQKNNDFDGIGIQWPITIVCVGLLFFVVFSIAFNPDAAIGMINTVFDITMNGAGPFLLLYNAIAIVFVFVMAFSKYGRIKFGDYKPEFSTFSYCAMMACAALASASMFWSFTEWAYYVTTPGLNIEANSQEAMEISLAYAYFHWGFLAQCTYALIGMITAYALYIRKLDTMSMSVIAEHMMGNLPGKKIIGRIIDVIVIFCTLGGLGVSLGLGIPVIAGGINRVTGMEVNFAMQVVVVIALAVVFSWSSFVGTGRGMRFLSDNTVKVLGILIAFIFIFGPTSFIQKLFVSSIGYMFQWMPRMQLFADPYIGSGFPEAWTIFFIAFPLTYAGLMGVFVAKISKGRTIKELVLGCMLGISIGTWVFFGINSGLAIDREISGAYSMLNEVNNGDPYRGIFTLLDTLPLGAISATVYVVCVFGFITTTLDTASLALAATTTKWLDADNAPSKRARLFWCIMLTLVPLSIMFSGAPFNALKSLAILVSTPLAVIITFMTIGMLGWMMKDKHVPGMLVVKPEDVAFAGVEKSGAGNA